MADVEVKQEPVVDAEAGKETVVDAGKQTPAPEVKPEPEVEAKDEKGVPYKNRFMEQERKAQKEAEKAALLEAQIAVLQQQVAGQATVKETEAATQEMVNDLVQEQGWSEEFAKKFIKKQRDLVKAEMSAPMNDLYKRTSETMSSTVLSEVLDTMPRAKKYRDEVVRKLNLLRDPTLKTDPTVVKDVIKLVLGEKLDEIEKEAELRGSAAAETQRKIVTGTEPVSSSASPAPVKLSESEKRMADNMGITYEDYAKSKAKLKSK